MNYLDELLKQAGGYNAPPDWGSGPQFTEFDPMATDSRLGNASQVEKEKNQLNTLFQGAIFAGDLEKAARLAVTAEQQALLGVAYGDRMSRQAGAPATGMNNYQRAQDNSLARSRMEQDRAMKQAEMAARIRASDANANRDNAQARQFGLPPRPKLGMGEQMGRDGTVQMIPGTAGYLRQADKHAKDYGSVQAIETKTDNAMKKIDEILDPKNEGAFNSNFGGYNAYVTRLLPGETQDMSARIDSLKANMKTAGLELVRAGGSIGQMTEREWPIVQDQLDRLDPRMGEKAAREAFQNIKVNFERIRNNAKEVYQTEWGNTQFAKKPETLKQQTEPQPLPTDKAALVPGNVYRTARGMAVWNGTAFEAR